MIAKPHKRLEVWKEAMGLVTSIYKISSSFPGTEQYGLTSQIRRAAISVPSNIAEGLTRASRKERLHFMHIARASISEIDTQLEIAERLGFINQDAHVAIDGNLQQTERLLSGLIRSLKQ